ncbi:MAG: hypothetical protein K9K88_06750 [Desulfobacterales bacterium]|nr:hypothetical protein [Desulfobacterales bacterium]
MAEIDYNNLKTPLSEAVAAQPSPVYLIFGEEMLVKEAFQAVLTALLPEGTQSLNCEIFDGGETDLFQVVERANTYSLMPGKKVVAVTDARLFLSVQDRARRVQKAREAAEARDDQAGARHLLAAMGMAGLTWDDLSGKDRQRSAKLLGVEGEDAQWLDHLVEYGREHHLEAPQDRGEEAVLQAAMEKGFPEGNHLLITTEQVDRRKRLYAVIREVGTVIDCAVPTGERWADRQAQEALLRKRAASILEAAGKTLDSDAFSSLVEMIGFDLRSFSGSLEKLIDYTGSQTRICSDDIFAVLQRSKKDPIFEFTNALTDRDLDGALFFLDSLLSGGVLEHPLQLLGAMVNQLRKLIVLKGFVESPEGRIWQPSMNFNAFKSRVLPALQAYDERLLDDLERWRSLAEPVQDSAAPVSKKKGASKKHKTDLRAVPNPKNPYPIFMTMQKSERFTLPELVGALKEAARADERIKTGGGDPRMILERAVFALCR